MALFFLLQTFHNNQQLRAKETLQGGIQCGLRGVSKVVRSSGQSVEAILTARGEIEEGKGNWKCG